MAEQIQEEQEPQNVMADEAKEQQEAYEGDMGINSILDETFAGMVVAAREDYAKLVLELQKI